MKIIDISFTNNEQFLVLKSLVYSVATVFLFIYLRSVSKVTCNIEERLLKFNLDLLQILLRLLNHLS